MLARFLTPLPFRYWVAVQHGLQPLKVVAAGFNAQIHVPQKSGLQPGDLDPFSAVPLAQVRERMLPVAGDASPTELRLNGQPAVRADLLQIDFTGPPFSRRRSGRGHEPPIDLCFTLANAYLMHLRVITSNPTVRPLSQRWFWRIDYLNDDGSELVEDPRLIRRRFSYSDGYRFSAITPAVWAQLQTVGLEAKVPPWQHLLLDAEAVLPEVGPSVVLAATALETFIAALLDHAAASVAMPAGLWDWITDRKDHTKDPSVEEQFSVLLQSLTGQSLTANTGLWESFMKLKAARNRFVHEGEARIGGTPVTPDRARVLIGQARAIIGLFEPLLPADQRLPVVPDQSSFEGPARVP